MLSKYSCYGALVSFFISFTVYGGELALVVDDIGYQLKQESFLLEMPAAISLAVLPNAPYAHMLATKAHQHGHEVLIHLPMAPLKPQSLEKDTLYPDMSLAEISRIIREATEKVPYAAGINNHMGSAMTRSLPGMQKVMRVLTNYHYYFLDSMTIGDSQSVQASKGTGVPVIRRQIFLDNDRNEAAIRKQLQLAVNLARRNGRAVAIGHPYPSTIRVLQQMIPALPPDITLVSPGMLVNQIMSTDGMTSSVYPAAEVANSHRSGYAGEVCISKQPLPAIPPVRILELVCESIVSSPLAGWFTTHLSSTKMEPKDSK